MLQDIGRSISQVFIFADNIEVALGIFVEADALLEVNRILLPLGLLTSSHDFAFFALVLTLANALIDQLCELGVIPVQLAVVQNARHCLALVLVRRTEVAVEKFGLDAALELHHILRYHVYFPHTAPVAHFHFLLWSLFYYCLTKFSSHLQF